MTIAGLYGGNALRKHIIHQRLVGYSIASSRESDGAQNRVILNGNEGAVGETNIYLRYERDGYIRLTGDNYTENDGWKLLSQFALEPGAYTLTGMREATENTVALQLRISDETGYIKYIYQWDQDVRFSIARESSINLHVRVYPFVEMLDTTSRPAVYQDE